MRFYLALVGLLTSAVILFTLGVAVIIGVGFIFSSLALPDNDPDCLTVAREGPEEGAEEIRKYGCHEVCETRPRWYVWFPGSVCRWDDNGGQ